MHLEYFGTPTFLFEFIYVPKHVDQIWNPLNLLFRGVGISFQGIKRPERESAYSTSSSVEAKNVWNYTSFSPTGHHGAHKNKFTLIVFIYF
jgi:hypothetical protein